MSEPDLAGTENGRERGKRLRTQRIISAARDLIHERPNESPTIPEVAGRAGVAPMTIFNLIGTRDDLWAALADESLADWQDVTSEVADPHQRARKIVDEVVRIISAEAPVWRALISGWRDSGRVLEREPSRALVACLQQAAEEGRIADGVDVRRLGAMIFSGLVGIVHQWAAGLIGERAMRRRARDLVDIAFAAGRPDNTSPTWDLGSG
jgi:AcrR family transcriptional regulator